jgi:hypothetical protein
MEKDEHLFANQMEPSPVYLSLTPIEGNTTNPTNFYINYIPSVFAQVTAVCSYPCHVLSCFSSQVTLTCADPVLACMVELGYHHRQTLKHNVYQCQAIQDKRKYLAALSV